MLTNSRVSFITQNMICHKSGTMCTYMLLSPHVTLQREGFHPQGGRPLPSAAASCVLERPQCFPASWFDALPLPI